MKPRISKYDDDFSLDSLLLRDRLKFGKYRKTAGRGQQKRELLMQLAFARMQEQEKRDYTRIGNRKRRLRTAET